jgi:hypothetical protein
MQVVFSKECQPVDTILLVLAELCLDINRDCVWFDFGPVKQLHQELALIVPTFE